MFKVELHTSNLTSQIFRELKCKMKLREQFSSEERGWRSGLSI